MLWKSIYLASSLSGLSLGVYTMLHGAERWRRKNSRKQSAAFNPPTVAALATAFGACGYLLATRSLLNPVAVVIVAAVAGLGAFLGMTTLMAKWALRSSNDVPHLKDEEVHGQIATVSRTLMPESPGEIRYEAWGHDHVLRARSVDGSEIPAGTEVAIEVIDPDGVARVELWSTVEQRL